MAYVVLARKYRPQTFDEVVGQEAVAQTLKNAIKLDRVAHAFLFSGPRGIGKTSLARILAKALNCETGITPEPCGKCVSCIAIAEGRDLDVIEIDGASNNGVENIRELRESSDYVALRSRHKVYIIDEVHMLSKGAFNALLKTLEEPPAHVKFILATTEPEKVPDTVHSRCQRYELSEIGTEHIVKRLEQICSAEEIEAEQGVLELIAQNVQGGMRDAQSALDQLRSFCGDRIDADSAAQILGIAGHQALYKLTDSVARGDAGESLGHVQSILNGRRAPAEVAGQWADFLREVLIGATCGSKAALLARPGTATPEEVAKLLPIVAPEFLIYAIQLLSETRSRMIRSMQATVLLEIAVIKLCRTGTFKPLAEIAQLASGPARSGSSAPIGSPEPQNNPTPPSVALPEAQEKKDHAMLSAFVDNNGFWDQLQNAVSESCGMMLASYLGEGQLTNIGEEEVTIQLANTFHRNQLLERANRQSVEACIEKLLGSPHRLNVIAGSPAKENAPAQPKAESHKPPSPPREQPSVQESIAIGDPNVEEVVRRFQGTVLSARELKPDQTEEI